MHTRRVIACGAAPCARHPPRAPVHSHARTHRPPSTRSTLVDTHDDPPRRWFRDRISTRRLDAARSRRRVIACARCTAGALHTRARPLRCIDRRDCTSQQSVRTHAIARPRYFGRARSCGHRAALIALRRPVRAPRHRAAHRLQRTHGARARCAAAERLPGDAVHVGTHAYRRHRCAGCARARVRSVVVGGASPAAFVTWQEAKHLDRAHRALTNSSEPQRTRTNPNEPRSHTHAHRHIMSRRRI